MLTVWPLIIYYYPFEDDNIICRKLILHPQPAKKIIFIIYKKAISFHKNRSKYLKRFVALTFIVNPICWTTTTKTKWEPAQTLPDTLITDLLVNSEGGRNHIFQSFINCIYLTTHIYFYFFYFITIYIFFFMIKVLHSRIIRGLTDLLYPVSISYYNL